MPKLCCQVNKEWKCTYHDTEWMCKTCASFHEVHGDHERMRSQKDDWIRVDGVDGYLG